MGKTIGALLTISAAIAVNLIPGGSLLSGALGSTLLGAAQTGATIAAVQALGGLLGLGPSVGKPPTQETALKRRRARSSLTK